MQRMKFLLSLTGAFLVSACLYCPIFHAMPKFMDRYDADPLAKPELKGKCGICHIREDGYGALNKSGKAFAENGYRINDTLRQQAPDIFAPGTGAAKPAAPAFDAKAAFAKQCAVCHGADGKGGEGTMIVPNFADAGWQRRHTEQQLIDAITKGKGTMPAFKEKLAEDQIKALAGFVRTFAGQ